MTTPVRRDVYTRYGGVDSVGTPLRISPEMMRANNSMSYREFIAVVKEIWEGSHPEIPICPTQGPQFANYPIITYSLEIRKTIAPEPKVRFREEIVDRDGSIYSIYGQRFQNLIAFSVMTRTDPELAEGIIETFEDFMAEYTGLFKELGASEIVYSRRMSDREENRTSEDIAVRTVAYLVTLEKNHYVHESKLEQISVDIRLFLDNQRTPGFTVAQAQVGTSEITLTQNNMDVEVGDFYMLKAIDNAFYTFPSGILSGYVYRIVSISIDHAATPSIRSAVIEHKNGNAVELLTTGTGAMLPSVLDNIDVTITDQLAEGATPSI